ncbi:hypothetical protein [Nocardia sp. NBC_00511]|uniref:hypothetical protein n=1 Tax=Nocardia sp. NBC_00511 TaxID=2903591 RepID=UPI0030E39DDA
MKKFVATAALVAGCAAGSFGTASADLPRPDIYDPYQACMAAGQTYDQCAAMANGTQPDQPSAGFGYTGSAASHS